MKRWAATVIAFAGLLQAACGQLASKEAWDCETTKYKAHPSVVRRGETRLFETTFLENGSAKDLSQADTVKFRYTPVDPATNATHYVITGSVYNATAGITRVYWTAAAAATEDDYEYEIAVSMTTQTLCRAFGKLTLEPGVGDASSVAGSPTEMIAIDWATVDQSNQGQSGFVTSFDLTRVTDLETHLSSVSGDVDNVETWLASVSGDVDNVEVWLGNISNDLDTAEATLVNTSNRAYSAYSWGDHALEGYLTGGTDTFVRVTAADTTSLGSELGTNGTFTGNADGWSLGGGANYAANKVHIAFGQTGTLSPSNALSITVGHLYYLSFARVTSDSGETITAALGGQTNTWAAGDSGTLTAVMFAGVTNSLAISVDAVADSVYIDNVSIKEITDGEVRAAGKMQSATGYYYEGENITQTTYEAAQAYADTGDLALSGQVDNLETWLASVSGDVDTAEALLVNVTNWQASISGDVDNVETWLASVSGDVDNVEIWLASVSGDVDTAEALLVNVTNWQASISGDVDNVEVWLGNISNDLNTAEATLASATSHIADIRGNTNDYAAAYGWGDHSAAGYRLQTNQVLRLSSAGAVLQGYTQDVGQAVSDSSDGEIILVGPGTYVTDIDVTTDITLVGAGPDATIRYAENRVASNATVTIVGMTLYGDIGGLAGLVLERNSDTTCYNCVLKGKAPQCYWIEDGQTFPTNITWTGYHCKMEGAIELGVTTTMEIKPSFCDWDPTNIVTAGGTVTISPQDGNEIVYSLMNAAMNSHPGVGNTRVIASDDGTNVYFRTEVNTNGGTRIYAKSYTNNAGSLINEFSTDVTLAGNSDSALPTEKAVKTYVDNNAGGAGGATNFAYYKLTGNLVLSNDAPDICFINPNGTTRYVSLQTNSTMSVGKIITLIDNGSDVTETARWRLYDGVYGGGGTMINQCWRGVKLSYQWNGTNWIGVDRFSSDVNYDANHRSLAIGGEAEVVNGGLSLLSGAAKDASCAIFQSTAEDDSLAIGASINGASADNKSIAIGPLAKATEEYYSVGIGYRSEALRCGEWRTAIDASSSGRSSWSKAGWHDVHAAANPAAFTEVYLKDHNTERWHVQPESASKFNGDCVAVDVGGTNSASYSFEGLICRDADNNTTLKWSNTTTDYEDDSTWDFQISADDVNEALKMEFKGYDSTKTNRNVYVSILADFVESME